jgi:hypothetical protein
MLMILLTKDSYLLNREAPKKLNLAKKIFTLSNLNKNVIFRSNKFINMNNMKLFSECAKFCFFVMNVYCCLHN